MSQSAFSQKQVTLLLVVVAVLLAAIVGVLVWQNQSTPVPAPVADASTPPAGMGGAQPPAGMGGAEVPQVEFDPATAPRVPEGQTPAEYVTAYYEACAAKEYAAAYALLPVASQQYYGDAAAFEQTLESYGVTEFAVGDEVDNGGTVSVIGGQEAQGMMVNYEWLFVKGDDGTLYLQSRTMAR